MPLLPPPQSLRSGQPCVPGTDYITCCFQMWGHATAWGYRLPVWFFRAVSRAQARLRWVPGCSPPALGAGRDPSLTSGLRSAHPAVTLADPCRSFGGCSDQRLDLKFPLFQGPGAAGHTNGIVILELAGGLQLLLTPRGGGEGRDDMAEPGTCPRDSVCSCFPASLHSCNILSKAEGVTFLSLLLSLSPTDFLLLALLSSLISTCSFTLWVFSQRCHAVIMSWLSIVTAIKSHI